jgi:hypothetical protein
MLTHTYTRTAQVYTQDYVLSKREKEDEERKMKEEASSSRFFSAPPAPPFPSPFLSAASSSPFSSSFFSAPQASSYREEREINLKWAEDVIRKCPGTKLAKSCEGLRDSILANDQMDRDLERMKQKTADLKESHRLWKEKQQDPEYQAQRKQDRDAQKEQRQRDRLAKKAQLERDRQAAEEQLERDRVAQDGECATGCGCAHAVCYETCASVDTIHI